VKFIVFHPTDATQNMSPAVLKDAENLSEFTTQRIPTILDEGLISNIRQASGGNHVLLTVTYTKSTRKEVRFRFRTLFVDEKPSFYWGVYLDCAIPRDDTQDIIISSSKTTGSSSQISGQNFEVQLDTLHKALNALFVQGPEETLVDEDVRTQARSHEVHALFEKLARASRKNDALKIKNKKIEADQRAQDMSNLPDGTPLAIRNGITGRRWQLGVKRGVVPKTLSQDARVVTPETLSSEAFTAAGLSRHKVLIMGALAKKVLSENPELVRFAGKSKRWDSQWSLDEKAPFHESFYDPSETKERRRNMDVVWIQTGSPQYTAPYYINDNKDFTGFYRRGAVNPNFPGSNPAPTIWSMTQSPNRRQREDLRDFDYIGGVMTFSARAADIIRDHNIGRTEIKPVMMLDRDKRHMEGRYYPVIHEVYSSIVISRLPSDLHSNLGMRGVKDFEVPISADIHGDLDLWADNSLRVKPLMFSGKLIRAIKKAKLNLPYALKRADIF